MKNLLLIIILTTVIAACGKKGPLIPPEAFAPAPVETLAVEQKGDRFFVSWAAPAVDAGGRPLKELAGFRLYRREVLPPNEDCEECPTAYRLVKSVDLEYPRDVRFYNNRYVFADSGIETGKTYQYKVIAFKKDGSEGSASNRARRKMVASPSAPVLSATSTATGVELKWEPGEAPGADFAGYNVYRRRGDDLGTLVLLTPVPVKARRFEDLRIERGVTYVYTVRQVIEVDGELVEGAVSNEAGGALAAPE